MTLVAVVPDVTRMLLGLEPLQVEGFILLVILLLGILLAWLLFSGPLAEMEEAAGGGR